ncbi:MAG: DUF362 domain-containing protein, partial [Anaerolineae bacterium]|nr:DUF362 domain-containing protein [Anaerolineae bacterium]
MSSHRDHLTRRQFLGLSGASLAALVSGLAARWPDAPLLPAQEADAFLPQVHVHSFDPIATTATDAVREAMLAATDLSWLNEGDSVFVKLACNSNYTPPSVTSPDVLEGVVTLLQEAGAGTVYVGDMSGAQFVRHLPDETIGSTRENMRVTGLLAAAEAVGATVHCFEEVPYADAYFMGVPDVAAHTWGADLQVASILDEVDHV